MDVIQLIANILSAGALMCNMLSSFFKKKRNILIMQGIDCGAFCIANIMMLSYAAAIVNFIAIFRNLWCNTKKKSWIFTILLVIAGVISNFINLYINNDLFIFYVGFLPIASTIQYTLWIGYCKNAQGLRLGMLVNYLPWIIHDTLIGLYSSALIMAISFLITAFNYIKFRKQEGQTEQ